MQAVDKILKSHENPVIEIRHRGLNKQTPSIAKRGVRQKINGQKALKPIALIKTGSTIPQIKLAYGDFEDWFEAGMEVTDLLRVDVFRHEPLPDAGYLSGVLVTGSPSMVSAKEDWSERTACWLKRVVSNDIPVLGICYGHQLLAHALGGLVGPNPNGRQIGTVPASLIESERTDRLFGQLPAEFDVQTSHSEVILKPPVGATRLATSPLDENFSVRFTERAWGIQFHPEFSAPVMSGYIRYRTEALLEEGLDPESLQCKITETEEAKSVLKRFVELTRM